MYNYEVTNQLSKGLDYHCMLLCTVFEIFHQLILIYQHYNKESHYTVHTLYIVSTSMSNIMLTDTSTGNV